MSEPAAHSQVETSTPKELVREPLVLNNRPLGWITNQVAGIVEGDMPKWWNIAFGVSFLLMLMSFGYIGYLITTGVGVWGLNHPVAWGWAIVNFVFGSVLVMRERSFRRFFFCSVRNGELRLTAPQRR